MHSFSTDPVIIFLQLKSFPVNQLNTLKKRLKALDNTASLRLAQNLTLPLQDFCQSSTFILHLGSLKTLKTVFENVDPQAEKFFDIQVTGLECILLGGFFQDRFVSTTELHKLRTFDPSKVNILGNLTKNLKLPRLLKQRLVRLPMILQANNGN
uniref:50S ribosomal protein L10 n=1 Tax=Ostreococcus tauri TaxID=70448 RepID=S5MLL5_OSTTA|nr:hypothetical protein OtMtg00200 [Ostreococcus tauri]